MGAHQRLSHDRLFPRLPFGTNHTIALTVRVAPEHTRPLVVCTSGCLPCEPHQDILVEAREAALDRVTT